MVSVDQISQQAIESISIEDEHFEDMLKRARQSTYQGHKVEDIETPLVSPGIQARPLPVITAECNEERIWWDPDENQWISHPTFHE